MNIGKITFDGYNNYGNTLQNYALQEYLKKYASKVETLWHSPNEKLEEFWKWGKKEELKFLLNHDSFRGNVKSGIRAWEFARRVRGMDFTQKHINIRYDIKDLKDVVDEYDYFVVGSDQVWNPGNPDLNTAFLKFCKKKQRISFAASIGSQEIPDSLKSYYKEQLSEMKAISVREQKAVDIIYDLIGQKCTLLLDPVFCINEESWRKISYRPYWKDDRKYVFAYFLGSIPKEVYEYSNKIGYDIIKCFDKDNLERYIISPEEWLYLLGNASYVFTDSFHATAFSIIFRRNFAVYPRNESKSDMQMITRIESILSTFNLENRFSLNANFKLGFIEDSINSSDIIKQELIKSDNFIKNALI